MMFWGGLGFFELFWLIAAINEYVTEVILVADDDVIGTFELKLPVSDITSLAIYQH